MVVGGLVVVVGAVVVVVVVGAWVVVVVGAALTVTDMVQVPSLVPISRTVTLYEPGDAPLQPMFTVAFHGPGPPADLLNEAEIPPGELTLPDEPSSAGGLKVTVLEVDPPPSVSVTPPQPEGTADAGTACASTIRVATRSAAIDAAKRAPAFERGPSRVESNARLTL